MPDPAARPEDALPMVLSRPVEAGTRPQRSLTSRPGLVLALACAAAFMSILDVSIVNVALPSMRESLHLSPAGLQWVINGYSLTFAGFLLLGGRAADLVGRKQVFVGGLALFTLASLAGGLAQQDWQLVVARTVQGIGGAVFTPATLALITTTFPGTRERARALGVFAGVAASAGALGGVIGGVITGLLGWRWVLFVNIPIGAVLIATAAWALRPDPRQRLRGRLDLAGSAMVTLGTGSLIGAIALSEQRGWGSPLTLGGLAAALVLLVAFGLVENRVAAPLVPLSVFRNRGLSLANGLALLTGGIVPAVFYFMSLHLQEVLRMEPLEAGVALLPAGVGMVAGAQLGPLVMRRVPLPVAYLSASLLSAVSLIWLSQLSPGSDYRAGILTPLFLSTVGFGAAGLPATVAAMSGVAPDRAGLASGLLNTARQIGGAVGLAVLVVLAAAWTQRAQASGTAPGPALTHGFALSLRVGAGLLIVAGLAGLALPHVSETQPAAPKEH